MSFNLIICCTNDIDWYILNHYGELCVLFWWPCFSFCAQVFLNAARASDLTSQKRQHANSRPGTRNMGVKPGKTQNFTFLKNANFFSYVNTRDKAPLQSRRNTEVEISMMSSDLNGLYKSPNWRDGLYLWSKGQVNFEAALTGFNSRQFKTWMKKMATQNDFYVFLDIFSCLTCNTVPENWHIRVNKGPSYIIICTMW